MPSRAEVQALLFVDYALSAKGGVALSSADVPAAVRSRAGFQSAVRNGLISTSGGYSLTDAGRSALEGRGHEPVTKRRSGPTIPETVRAERGTGQVVSVRLAPETVRALDELRAEGESRGAAITRLVLAAK